MGRHRAQIFRVFFDEIDEVPTVWGKLACPRGIYHTISKPTPEQRVAPGTLPRVWLRPLSLARLGAQKCAPHARRTSPCPSASLRRRRRPGQAARFTNRLHASRARRNDSGRTERPRRRPQPALDVKERPERHAGCEHLVYSLRHDEGRCTQERNEQFATVLSTKHSSARSTDLGAKSPALLGLACGCHLLQRAAQRRAHRTARSQSSGGHGRRISTLVTAHCI